VALQIKALFLASIALAELHAAGLLRRLQAKGGLDETRGDAYPAPPQQHILT
jgi:hypothetical protein